MNFVIFSGNLVDKMELRFSSSSRAYAHGKIGVYQGKDDNGEIKPSMFFEFTCFGKDAELLTSMANKGDKVAVCGRLEESTYTTEDGRTFVNKHIICQNAVLCQKQATQNPATQNNTMNGYDPSLWESSK